MKDFRDLRVWNEAHQLTLKIYAATRRFPREELYGLTSQMRRCSVSIGANIAEGCGKRGNNEFQRFLVIATGSASELDYELLLSKNLQDVDETTYCSLQRRSFQATKNAERAVAEGGRRAIWGQVLNAKCHMPAC
jgi:four helix bundle protein